MDKLADLFYNFYNELFCTDMSNKYVKKSGGIKKKVWARAEPAFPGKGRRNLSGHPGR